MSERSKPLFHLFQLGLAIHHLNQKTEKSLGLSLGQWCLLAQLIDMPGTNAQALASAVGVHASTLTQTLKRLEQKRLLFITDDPKDSRKKLISITRRGKEMLDLAESKFKGKCSQLTELGPQLHSIRQGIAMQVAQL